LEVEEASSYQEIVDSLLQTVDGCHEGWYGLNVKK